MRRPVLSAFLACAFAFAIASAALLAAFASHRASFSTPNMVDLRAFRCGATIALHGGDPYRNEPLHACERDAERAASIESFGRLVVVPVPLPPYAFVLYAPLAAVSYAAATILFAVASICGTAFLIVVLRRLTALPLLAVAATVVAGIWLPAALLGQPVVFVCAALVAAAAFVREGRALA
ncbi:MAG: hypothetical protein IAI48_07565, partial [Candidatus Eremiobacteraeota bacterium]|nr:hypothetical protein [Candidatus Eremiobacteraeota bacterium]